MHLSLEFWLKVCKTLFPDTLEQVAPVHPCVINGQPHLVHHPKLREHNPTLYQRLTQKAHKAGAVLKEDRRATSTEKNSCKRKAFVPIVFFTLGSALSQPSLATELQTISAPPQKVKLQLYSNSDTLVASPFKEKARLTPVTETPLTAKAQAIYDVLLARFNRKDAASASMLNDLKGISIYYAKFSVVEKLILKLDNYKWQLHYQPYTFQTNVKGNKLEVKSVDVYFDPRSAAQLKFYNLCDQKMPFCAASPADALLHELLHVDTILSETKTFIAQGGMSAGIYPAEHEYKTISKENLLYRYMTAVDGQPRPIRNEHIGRRILVSCATCVE